MHSLKVGLVVANQELQNQVQACLQKLAVRVLLQQPALGEPTAFLGQLERLRLDVLLIDLTQLQEPFEQLVRRIKSGSLSPMIIALNDTADPEVILGAIRAGANEFLYPPLEAGLQKALERLLGEHNKAHASGRQAGKTLGFLSAKGGCGATTIACHVAVEMQRSTSQDVLLADFDVDTGMVGFLMRAKTQYSILDAVRNVHRLDASYWKALVSNGQAHLEVITAPPTASIREMLDPEQFRDVLRFLRSSYEWIVTDLGRSLNPLSLGVLDDIDEMFLIATLDLPSLHQSKKVIEVILDEGYGCNRLHLILNRVPKRPDFTPSEVQKVLGVPVYEMLPNDYPELYEAYTEGTLLPASSELGKSLAALAVKISGVQAKKEKPKPRANLSIF